MSQPYTVLITCLGGVYSRETVEALRLDRSLRLRIVGCDADASTVNRYFVDEFRVVPNASAAPEQFGEVMLALCREMGVSLVISGADEEVLALSRRRADFEAMGVTCAVERPETLAILRDKATLFDCLRAAGVAVPAYRRVESAGDVRLAAEMLGYPDRPFVLKPSTGRGARGLMLVDARERGVAHPAGTRGYVRGDLAGIAGAIAASGATGLLAMEYLPGPAYDVDCVATRGVPHCTVVRRRLWRDPLSPVSQGCRVERHPALEALTREVVAALGLSFACDLDFGTGSDEGVGLFEVNPRWSGAVASALAGGVNVPAVLVRSVRGMALGETEPRPGRSMYPVTRMVFVGGDAAPATGVEQL
ncbi:MAG: hypothetical protein AMXMBFR57_16750 [Acidimicrobiia bacterium]